MDDFPQEAFTRVILDSIADGVFTVDSEWRITSFNRAAERITGIPKDEALGRRCCEVFRASICESDCALRHTLDTGRPVVNRSIYIIDAEGDRIPISISTALLTDEGGKVMGGVETFRDLSVVETLRKALEDRRSLGDMISSNPRMLELFAVLPNIAESESTVLILGESGTGKELLARAIHSLSPRAKKPFVAVNCGALPDTLLESELFGHRAGAFTDARRDREGRFARARGGTLFLDEIGDISPAMQVRLLRVLQDGVFEALGDSKPQQADVRILAATHRDLDRAVKDGAFRQDLYYRIHVVPLKLPPLRERKEDIPLLAEHLVQRFNRLKGYEVRGIAPEAMDLLMGHDFPGNIRELENVIEHAFVLCREGYVEPRHLPEPFRGKAGESIGRSGKEASSFEELEARFLKARLEANGFNRVRTARELGIHKTTLWRKMKKLGLVGKPGE